MSWDGCFVSISSDSAIGGVLFLNPWLLLSLLFLSVFGFLFRAGRCSCSSRASLVIEEIGSHSGVVECSRIQERDAVDVSRRVCT